MEVVGTKFSVWLLYSHPRRTRGRELRLKKAISLYLAVAQRVRGLATQAQGYSLLSTTPSNTPENMGKREGKLMSKERQKYQAA